MSLQMKTVAPAPEAADAKPKAKSMLPVIIAAVALACFGAGFLVMHFMTGKPAAKPAVDPNAYVKVGETVPLDEFMVNSADPGNDHYLKTTIALGLKEGIKAEAFKEKLPEVRDVILLVLTSKRVDDVKSTAGKLALKKTLISRINSALAEHDVADVYFQDFAMQ